MTSFQWIPEPTLAARSPYLAARASREIHSPFEFPEHHLRSVVVLVASGSPMDLSDSSLFAIDYAANLQVALGYASESVEGGAQPYASFEVFSRKAFTYSPG